MGDRVVKPRFAWSLPTTQVRALGAVRRWSGVEVLAALPLVWLRAAQLADEQWELVRRLPGADRYTVLDDGQLIGVGNLVPLGRLPAGGWQPLQHWLEVELPPADEPLTLPESATLRLVRSTAEREATWLRISFSAWMDYVITAPQVRLARWSFVADHRSAVVIRGAPLPPLPGFQFVESDGIAVPLGWSWSPSLPADVLREVFTLEPNESVLCLPDGRCERITVDDWVQATRSAARLTEAALLR